MEYPDWLPDWRSAAAYPEAGNTDYIFWAWEFLRRNPDYQKAYIESQTLFKDGDVVMPKKSDIANKYVVCDPPAFDSETIEEYGERMDRENKTSSMQDRYSWLKNKYALALGFIDPGQPLSDRNMFALSWGPEYFCHDMATEGRGHMHLESQSNCLVRFDLALPIDVQINRAKKNLGHLQKRLIENKEIEPLKKRNHVRLFPTYLRALDAELAGESVTEMALVLFDHMAAGNSNAPGDRQIKNILNAAKRYRDHDYRYLPLSYS